MKSALQRSLQLVKYSLRPQQEFSLTRLSFITLESHPYPGTSHHPPKMPGQRRMLCSWLAHQADQLANWESWTFVPPLLPLLAAREDLGDTKQEAFNKWTLWMFISRHSSNPQNQRSRDPAGETRLWSGSHRGVRSGLLRTLTGVGRLHPTAGSPPPFSQSSRSQA